MSGYSWSNSCEEQKFYFTRRQNSSICFPHLKGYKMTMFLIVTTRKVRQKKRCVAKILWWCRTAC